MGKLVIMGHAMTRAELQNILAAIDCVLLQVVPGAWQVESWGSVDDVFHALFDDFDRRGELAEPSLNRLYQLLGEILEDVGDAPGTVFSSDHRWPSVLEAAAQAKDRLSQWAGQVSR